MMAAWALVKIGDAEVGLACLDELLFVGDCENTGMLHNVIDWVGEPAYGLVKKYMKNGGWMGPKAYPLIRKYIKSHPNELNPKPKGTSRVSILAHAALVHGLVD